MATITEVACLLASAVEGAQPGAAQVCGLLSQLCSLLEQPDDAAAEASAATELDELLFDLHASLIAAAALSPTAEAHVRALLAAAARHCTAREVFTLGMATLSQQLSGKHAESTSPPATYGPDSPAFQLFLLEMLAGSLPRIRRRPLHFLAELLQMQLRWAAEVLPSLALGSCGEPAGAPAAGDGPGAAAEATDTGAADASQQPACVAGAVARLAALAADIAGWVQQAGEEQQQQQQQQQQQGRLSAADQQVALHLLASALLQLTSMVLQLPQVLEAAARGVMGPAGSGATAAAAPALGSRLPLMQAAGEELLCLPQVLLRQVPAAACASGSAIPEDVHQLALTASTTQLAASGLDPADLAAFSAAEAEQGAAAAACAAAWAPDVQPQLQRSRLQELLPQAARLLLDLGAQHQSVALTLLPLGALCTAGAAMAAAGSDAQLAASSPALDALFSAVVAIMSHNPVQLIRSCAHDAVQALLDAFQPGARLAQLRALMQMPSTAAAVVALQRLRQEMAAAWAGSEQQQRRRQQQQQQEGQPWMCEAALQLALPCLERGAEDGWHDEGSVLRQADVQAAALSLLRWVLLREAAAPRGLLPSAAAQRLLRLDLMPLQACVQRLLQMQSRLLEGSSGSGSSGSGATLEQRQQLESFLAAQRLHEALDCVVDLLQQSPPGVPLSA